MKRILKLIGLVVLVVVLGVGSLLAVTFMGRKAIMDGQEINRIRIIEDGITSFAIVPIDNRQVVLIDAGNDQNGEAVLAELTRRGLGPDAVSTILLTHGHPDHTGGGPSLSERAGNGTRARSTAGRGTRRFQGSGHAPLPGESDGY
jgi:glyoxylase-like metal-dependent hydrolase (beta-lactamase superfamily II)